MRFLALVLTAAGCLPGAWAQDRQVAEWTLFMGGAVGVKGGHELIREIRTQMRELGAGTLMALLQFGSLPHALACKNSKLFAERVLPELKRA